MGGGVSSLSKVCVVGPSSRPDADIDYTFAQVQVKEAKVDYGGNCGNMSSAMGPFAVDEGLVKAAARKRVVRVHNTNTKKIIWSRFPLDEVCGGRRGARDPGCFRHRLAGRLEFREPGGATTGKLLPTGNVADISTFRVWARSRFVGRCGQRLRIRAGRGPRPHGHGNARSAGCRSRLLEKLAAIRLAASVAMGMTKTPEEAAKRKSVPFVGFVSGPQPAKTLTGEALGETGVDLTGRMMSNGQPHRALPLTCTLCMAVAARLEGSVVARGRAHGRRPGSRNPYRHAVRRADGRRDRAQAGGAVVRGTRGFLSYPAAHV